MEEAHSITNYGGSGRPSYEVRVRGTTYLWGSAGITHDLTYHAPLILYIRNSLHGEVITLGPVLN